jgi:hypothetical protein
MAKADRPRHPPFFAEPYQLDFNASVWGVKEGFYSEPPLSRQIPTQDVNPASDDDSAGASKGEK